MAIVFNLNRSICLLFVSVTGNLAWLAIFFNLRSEKPFHENNFAKSDSGQKTESCVTEKLYVWILDWD